MASMTRGFLRIVEKHSPMEAIEKIAISKCNELEES